MSDYTKQRDWSWHAWNIVAVETSRQGYVIRKSYGYGQYTVWGDETGQQVMVMDIFISY